MKTRLVILLFLFSIFSIQESYSKKVLLLSASSYGETVKSTIVGTGEYQEAEIDVLTGYGDPSSVDFTQYDAILLWSDGTFNDRAAWGNAIVDYINAGGGVVNASFEITTQSTGLAGNFNEDYMVIVRGAALYSTSAQLGTIDSPSHPIMDNVSSFSLTTYSASISSLQTGAYRVASYNDGRVLIAARENVGSAGARRATVNFCPGLGWDKNTDGGLIMANALNWVAGGIISGEQKAVIGVPDTITFSKPDNATFTNGLAN